MTKSRMIYLSVLSVALLALAWDRLVSQSSWTSPGDAGGSTVSPGVTESVPSGETWDLSPRIRRAMDAFVNSQSGPAIALSATLDSAQRDVFTPTTAMRALMSPPARTEAVEQPDVAHLISQLRLSSVVIGPDRETVMLNGELVAKDQSIGPYRIVEIERQAIVVEVLNERIRINLRELR